MNRKTTVEEDRDLLRDHRSQPACEDGRHRARVRTCAAGGEWHRHFLNQAPAARHLVLSPGPLSQAIHSPRDSGVKQAGIFHEFPRFNPSLATESLRRPPVDLKEADPFHDSESEDLVDLYVACNGVQKNGRLDISQLDEYGPDEAEALNVPRLIEIWAHTDGCPECERIIRRLDSIRGELREDVEELSGYQNEAVDEKCH